MKALKKVIYLALVLMPIVWLCATNAGLGRVLSIINVVSPYKFTYKCLDGKLIGQPIDIHGLIIVFEDKKVEIEHIHLNWLTGKFNAVNIYGLSKLLPKAELLADQELKINSLDGHFKLAHPTHTLNLQFTGQSLQTKLTGSIAVIYINGDWTVEDAIIEFGKNTLALKKQAAQNYVWDLQLTDPRVIFKNSKGVLIANGQLQNLFSTPTINAKVKTSHFNLDSYKIHNLIADISIAPETTNQITADISADNISINKNSLSNLKIKLHGNPEQHFISCNTLYNKVPVKLNLTGTWAEHLWQTKNIVFKYQNEQLTGKAFYNFIKRNGMFNINGNILNTKLVATMELQKNNNLNGNVTVTSEDIAFLMQWMPDVTRLKGKFFAQAKLNGTVSKPEIIGEAHLTEITATMPHLGIKIKPMEIHLSGDKHGKFTLTGKGAMRRGSGEFTLHGYIEPFKPQMPNSISINATNMEFINNKMANLIGSSKIKMHFAMPEQRIDIIGDITIHEGNLNLAGNASKTVKTKDIVFAHEAIANKNPLLINPVINLRIEEGIRLSGFGIDADISGKLDIVQRNNALYADGRITIKEGKFKLPGQELTINKGRLLYPPGTLLINPVLDIKMHTKNDDPTSNNSNTQELELIVQGTAQKPVISERGLANNKDFLISQALITGSGMLSNNILQDKLKIDEIGLVPTNPNAVNFFDEQNRKTDLKNKDLIVGRSLGKKTYIQYLHNMGETNERLRLKYSLNKIWALGIESGTQGGGVDLSFSIETD